MNKRGRVVVDGNIERYGSSSRIRDLVTYSNIEAHMHVLKLTIGTAFYSPHFLLTQLFELAIQKDSRLFACAFAF